MTASTSARLVGSVAALTFLVVACGSDGDPTADTTSAAATETSAARAPSSTSGSPETTPAAGAPGTTADPASTAASGDLPTDATIEIGEFVFDPPEVHVAVGGTVTWTNTHTQPHTATSAGAFDTGAIEPGSSARQTFAETGTFDFICSFHPFMTGSVVVG